MKKVVLLVIIVVGFFSCSNNIEFNTPALQAERDGEIWKATSFRANIDANGVLSVTGTSDDSDNLTLRVPSTVLANYELGNTISEATYNDGINTLFSTNNSPDPDVSIFEPDGQIEIYEYDTENNLVSGRFNFNAFDISGVKTINFSRGDFYRVPVTGEPIDNACDVATQLVMTTETVFNATTTADPDFPNACNSYKNALTNKINACGDPDGSLQVIINSLGDCAVDNSDPCAIATANTDAAEMIFNATPVDDPEYPNVCNTYRSALSNKITQCGDADGSIQAIIDNLGDCMSTSMGIISLDLGTASLTFETNITITKAGTLISVSAEDDASGNIISFMVEENATGVDIISNFMIQVGPGGTLYVPTTDPNKTFTSNITVNNATDIEGTFSGSIESDAPTTPDFELSNGVIDVMY